MTPTTQAVGVGEYSRAEPLLRPRALVAGSTIGVVMPSTAPRPNRVARGVRALERAGFRVKLDTELDQPRRYHPPEDARRAERLMQMWSDPGIDALIAGTGGYGAVRTMQ